MVENPPPRSASALASVRGLLETYREEVEATAMTETSKKTYLLHAENFVRWREGDFTPGDRVKSRGGP